MNTHTIDATNKKIGRVSSEAAKFLIGKNLTSFVRNAEPEVKVTVINAGKASVTTKKKRSTVYRAYSGHPGVIEKTMEMIIAKKGVSEVIRLAVRGMLPSNKLRAKMLKNLTVTE